MSKKLKSLLIIVIILIIAILGGIFIYNVSQYKTYQGEIIGISDDIIFVSSTPEILENVTQYDVTLFPNNSYDYAYVRAADWTVRIDDIPTTKDINGKKISPYDLKVGNKVKITYKKSKEGTPMINPAPLYNVKLIQVI